MSLLSKANSKQENNKYYHNVFFFFFQNAAYSVHKSPTVNINRLSILEQPFFTVIITKIFHLFRSLASNIRHTSRSVHLLHCGAVTLM